MSRADELFAEARAWQRELQRTPATPMLRKLRRQIELDIARLRAEAFKALTEEDREGVA